MDFFLNRERFVDIELAKDYEGRISIRGAG